LVRAGIGAEAIHGNKSQNQRERVLSAFRKGEIRTLVATDIAARGIDVDGISHVVNFDLPNVPETYVHRIGRTARAGAEGVAISLCDGEEMAFLRDIEKLIRMTVPASDRRTERRRAESPRVAADSFNPGANSQQRRGKRRDQARKQNRHGQPRQAQSDQGQPNQSKPNQGQPNRGQQNHGQSNQGQPNRGAPNGTPRGIDTVAFMGGKRRPKGDRAPRAQRWAGHSEGL
jgi:ATP-dependent RNA helicase RhlE